MAADPNRTPPDDDPGFEVVDDSPPAGSQPPAAKPRPAPPRPPAAGTSPARPATPVVPPAVRPAAPAAARPASPAPAAPRTGAVPPTTKPPGKLLAAQPLPAAPKPPATAKPPVVARPPAVEAGGRPPVPPGKVIKAAAVVADDDEDDASPKKGRVVRPSRDGDLDQHGDVDATPRKMKLSKADKCRIREEMAEDRRKEIAKEKEEWLVPGVLMGIGVVLTLGAGGYQAVHSVTAALATVVLFAVSAVYVVCIIPVAILLMIVIGKLAGIEYGSLKHVVRSLGAVTVLLVGVYWMTSALFGCVALLVTPPIAGLITYVLFVKFFDLDANEARVSAGVMNSITFFGNIFFQVVLGMFLGIGNLDRDRGRFDPDDFSDDEPGLVEPGDKFGPDGNPQEHSEIKEFKRAARPGRPPATAPAAPDE